MKKIKKLDIKNVRQVHKGHLIIIQFEVKEYSYGLYLYKDFEGKFYPEETRHYPLTTQICDLCLGDTMICHALSGKEIDVLFRHLITFPSIRLEWLYIDH